MSTKNIYSPTYRKKYFEGYSKGFNPFLANESSKKGEAFNSGFTSGRMDYESMNGAINEGIPLRIVTKKILEDFLLAGMIGLKIDSDNYNLFQISVIREWYLCGVEMYNPKESMYLFNILEENGIQIF
ncbi:hypothetical protein [Flavobacterium cellulosilyticum]|uniref:Uncharacterized protein n=1 Tax=Flavobacterium cellulosilyticum TaxID=2541731 RepID=A0A4R5CF63_9FLAO|nr:hypothetical protein [Flavobacterium cellulosilyticum]TDD98748.1 hypothetical protein E0F76_06370 [Flavobacterium cellulosilyticum]